MANSKRICWDSCAWISLISREKIVQRGYPEDRGMMCRVVMEAAQKGSFEIVSSGLALVEVCRQPAEAAPGEDKIASFFDNEFILIVDVGFHVGTLGRNLMMRQLPGLKPADATHIATAMIANVEAFHTFDQRLLDLDRRVNCLDGRPLKICKPEIPGDVPPLLSQLSSLKKS